MDIRISLINQIKIKLMGKAYLYNDEQKGWEKSLPFYAFECPSHGIVVNYPHGFKKRLVCPKCLQELSINNHSLYISNVPKKDEIIMETNLIGEDA